MSAQLNLRVVTPAGTSAEAEVPAVSLPGVLGEFTVLPMHTTYLARLQPGLVKWSEGAAAQSLALRAGIAQVADDRVTVIAEETWAPADLDDAALGRKEAALREDLERRLLSGEPTGDLSRELEFLVFLRSLAARG